MTWIQRDLYVPVLLADRTAIVVGEVDAADGHADVVYNRGQLGRGYDLADRTLDPAKGVGAVLDACTDLKAHVHQDLSRINFREEVAPERRHHQERGEHEAEKTENERPPV